MAKVRLNDCQHGIARYVDMGIQSSDCLDCFEAWLAEQIEAIGEEGNITPTEVMRELGIIA